MEYITIKEASARWGTGTRIITVYCVEGRIAGAVKKGNLWLIPADAAKPADRRRKRQAFPAPILPLREDKALFARLFQCLPYPMHVCASDGTMLFANEAFFRFVKAPAAGLIENNNILNNPNLERWGVKDFVLRAYQGEVVHAYDVKVPLQELVAKYGGHAESISESLFHNMTAFPIFDEHDQLAYVATIFTTSRHYQGKEVVIKGKEYLDEQWREDFDADQLADIVHVSRYHYTRLFKEHVGMTPHNYHKRLKLNKLKELLCDENLTITQAFDSCGANYNGHLAKEFKKETGMTPSQYRAMKTEK